MVKKFYKRKTDEYKKRTNIKKKRIKKKRKTKKIVKTRERVREKEGGGGLGVVVPSGPLRDHECGEGFCRAKCSLTATPPASPACLPTFIDLQDTPKGHEGTTAPTHGMGDELRLHTLY